MLIFFLLINIPYSNKKMQFNQNKKSNRLSFLTYSQQYWGLHCTGLHFCRSAVCFWSSLRLVRKVVWKPAVIFNEVLPKLTDVTVGDVWHYRTYVVDFNLWKWHEHGIKHIPSDALPRIFKLPYAEAQANYLLIIFSFHFEKCLAQDVIFRYSTSYNSRQGKSIKFPPIASWNHKMLGILHN